MASIPKQAPVRRLVELLQEQQEPFLLDIYLLEKGYSRRIPTSSATNNSCIRDSCRKLLKLTSSGSRNSRATNGTSNLLRSVLKKLNFVWHTSSHDEKTSITGRSSLSSCYFDEDTKAQVVKLNQFSSSSHGVAFESQDKQDTVDTKLLCACTADCKQFSPVSVLESPSDEGSPAYNHRKFCPRTITAANPFALDFNKANSTLEDSVLSASLWDILGPGSSQKVKSKRVLQQMRLLLFDCVREVVENHARNESWHLNACVGPEKLGKMVFDEILSWGKQYADKSNITRMTDFDFSEPRQLGKHFQPQIKDIGIEIGDTIFEELRDEIVEDMLHLLFSGRS